MSKNPRPRRLTAAEKKLLSAAGIENVRFWQLLEDKPDHYIFIHRLTGRVKEVDK